MDNAKPLRPNPVRAKSRSVTTLAIPLAAAIAAAVPAGIAAAFLARRFAHSSEPALWVAILGCVLIAVWSATAMPSAALIAVTCILGWTLLVLATVDVLAFRLPDLVTFPLIGAGLAVSWFLPAHDLPGHAIGAAAGFAALYAIAMLFRMARGKEGLGLGDAKLAAAAGAWLGWQALSYVVLLACAVGFLWFGVALARRGRAAAAERIPFGVALSLAIWIVWLYGLPAALDPAL